MDVTLKLINDDERVDREDQYCPCNASVTAHEHGLHLQAGAIMMKGDDLQQYIIISITTRLLPHLITLPISVTPGVNIISVDTPASRGGPLSCRKK
eukprot:7702436-Heterocapsa_arctica.AAC.1